MTVTPLRSICSRAAAEFNLSEASKNDRESVMLRPNDPNICTTAPISNMVKAAATRISTRV